MNAGAVRSGRRDSLEPRVLIPTLTTGLVTGIVQVVMATSFAALIFSGTLAAHLPAAIGLSLFAAITVLAIVALGSSLAGAVGSVQDTSSAILAIMAAAIAQRLSATGEVAFLTIVLAITLTSLLTGGFFLLLGTFRLGNLVRFIPYPVVGGFLAGTGWLLLKGGLGLLAGTSLTLEAVPQLLRADVAIRWVPGVAFAIVLLASTRWRDHFLIIPGAIIGGVVLFYAILLATGGSVTEAQAGGWLLGPLPGGGLWRPWLPTALADADWSAVLGQGGSIATVLLLSVLALLLNATGIELIAGRDVDLNRELRAAGAANVVSGLGGGLVGFHALSLTALALRSGAASRLVGLVAAGVCGVTLLFGAQILSLIPRLVVGGLVVFLGIAFLFEWVVESWRKLPRADYAVVLLILLVVATAGFLQGVGVGLVLVVVLFVVNYSRTELVRSALSGRTYQSNLDRPPIHREALRSAGERTHILLLQGFLFFGTATRLLDRIRDRVMDPDLPNADFLVLDFRRVSGLDSSAVLSFSKTLRLAESQSTQLVLAGLSEGVRAQMDQADFPLDRVPSFPELDRAVEWCEDHLLARQGLPPIPEEPWAELRSASGEALEAERLVPYLERMEVSPNGLVIRQNEPSEDLYFVESGRLTAELTRPDGTSARLRSMGPGTVVGEVAFYTGAPRSASVRGDDPSVLLRLSRRSLARMETNDPELAAALHRMLARTLAERLGDTVSGINALLD